MLHKQGGESLRAQRLTCQIEQLGGGCAGQVGNDFLNDPLIGLAVMRGIAFARAMSNHDYFAALRDGVRDFAVEGGFFRRTFRSMPRSRRKTLPDLSPGRVEP